MDYKSGKWPHECSTEKEVDMFKSYTLTQAFDNLLLCRGLLERIHDKGNVPFDKEDSKDLDKCISTLFVLMQDADIEQPTSLICGALLKGQTMLHNQKNRNKTGFYVDFDQKIDLLEAIAYIDEAVELVKQGIQG